MNAGASLALNHSVTQMREPAAAALASAFSRAGVLVRRAVVVPELGEPEVANDVVRAPFDALVQPEAAAQSGERRG